MIAIVIVTYNGLKWVDKCFGSLFNSSMPVQVIAIDNASTDGTPEYIQKHFPEVDLIENKENLGFGQANNIGIRKAYDAGADYVFLLNQDAWVEKDTIEKLVEIAERNPEFGIVSPMHLNGVGDALDYFFSLWIAPEKCPNLFSDIFLGKIKNKPYETSFVNAAAWLMSRQCINTVGGFNPLFFLYGEDDNYLQRVKYHNLKIGVVPQVCIYHDRHERDKKYEHFRNKNLEEIQLLTKYCDPRKKEDIAGRKIFLLKRFFKTIFKLKFTESFVIYKEIKKVNGIQKQVSLFKEKSKKKGLSFLDNLESEN